MLNKTTSRKFIAPKRQARKERFLLISPNPGALCAFARDTVCQGAAHDLNRGTDGIYSIGRFTVKRFTLKPMQVLATDELAPEEESSLRIYYSVFRNDGGDCLPPIIVGTIRSANEWIYRLEKGYARWERKEPRMVDTRRREYQILFRALRGTPHYILDGNHRALAAALNHRELKVLDVESDGDLFEIERMVTAGELFSFPHKARSLEELEGLFIQHFLNLNNIPPNHSLEASENLTVRRLVPVATRAYELCTHNQLPAYMVARYI